MKVGTKIFITELNRTLVIVDITRYEIKTLEYGAIFPETWSTREFNENLESGYFKLVGGGS